MKIGLIGAGKVGTSLGKLFSECGAHITGYYSRSFDHARQAAEFTSSVPYQTLEALVQESDTLFVTTPDGVLQTMIGEIAALPVKEKRICHCSGALASDVFAPAAQRGARVC